MLFKLNELIKNYNVDITGILHIGAHKCEERDSYLQEGITNVYWVEAMKDNVDKMKSKYKDIHIYQSLIDIENDKSVQFNIASNGQSSSILEFGSHLKHHPEVQMIGKTMMKTTRLDKLINENNIPIKTINFMNIDIQGKELDAIKSMGEFLTHIKYIYTEVNTETVYENYPLISDIDKYLLEFGFTRVCYKIWGNCGWGDAFYIKNKKEC